MSWDGYLDKVVAQSTDSSGAAHADKAVIIGLDGKKWTSDGNGYALKISNNEAAKIASVFKSNKFDDFMTGGVVAAGVKYQFLRVEDGKMVVAKKKDNGGLSMLKTKTAIVIGHCKEGGQIGNVNKGVGFVADYMEGYGM